jgi:hypothetical protein
LTRAVALLISVLALAALVLDVVHLDYFGVFVAIPVGLLPLALVGAFLIARIPRNPVGWLLALTGLLFQLTFAAKAESWLRLVQDRGSVAGAVLAGISSATFPVALGCAVLLLLFFPSGRGLGGRWTWLERLLVTFVVLLGVTSLFKDAPIEVFALSTTGQDSWLVANPLALGGPIGDAITLLSHVGDSTTVPIVLIGPLSLIVRYRRASSIEREQIKWLAYSATLAFLLFVGGNFVGQDVSYWLWGAGAVALGLMPIAIAIAIFRYRLYDIDVLIRRTLIYATVSALLAAAYIGGVALFQTILAPITAGSGVAVAISTLAVVALFQPVRTRIRSAVDRRFYRSKYDAERTLETFSARLREQVDLASLERELVGVVNDTMQPVYASVWLRGAKS